MFSKFKGRSATTMTDSITVGGSTALYDSAGGMVVGVGGGGTSGSPANPGSSTVAYPYYPPQCLPPNIGGMVFNTRFVADQPLGEGLAPALGEGLAPASGGGIAVGCLVDDHTVQLVLQFQGSMIGSRLKYDECSKLVDMLLDAMCDLRDRGLTE
jgi:hypothetical protein